MSNGPSLSYRQIIVGRFPTGLTGLDEILASLYEAGREPGAGLLAELLARTRQHNYIPVAAEDDFAAALLREYQTYYEQLKAGQPAPRRETYLGVPREQVPWFPVLDESLCDGCDKCLAFCAHAVYARRESGIVYVAQPMQCVVGCDACARLCRHRAIVFPPRSVLTSFRSSADATGVMRLG